MLTRINKHRGEAGFTLIELLVVVIIIGILAAIAIPVFLNQRNSARNASVQSDLRTIALEAESYYTVNQKYPSGAETDPAHAPVTISNSNQIQYGVVTGTIDGKAVTGFEVVGCNGESGTVYVYDSLEGGLQDAGTAPTSTFACVTDGSANDYQTFSLTAGLSTT